MEVQVLENHAVQFIKEELFASVLKWDIQVEIQIVALQSVMADLLAGDTIHHALNIRCVGRTMLTHLQKTMTWLITAYRSPEFVSMCIPMSMTCLAVTCF